MYNPDDYGYNNQEEDPNFADPYQPEPVHPGANTGHGPWAPGYDPGANWNDGVAPNPDALWAVDTKQWEGGTQAPAAAPAAAPVQSGSTAPRQSGGAVNSISMSAPSSGINVPSANLPQGILDLFNKPQTVTPIQSAYQDALLGFMKRGQTTPTLDDSILGPQTEVFRAAQQRNTERQRRSVAERAAANGQSESGYLDQQINKGVQEQGFNTASFNANLLGGEMNKRREELQAGLQLASATGNAEAARELQAKLAQISAMMQQQGLNLQGQLGSGDLALRWGLGTENLNQQALQIIMNGMQP